jgi:tetratricopeptide (TPR) repeat protein
MRRTTKLLVGGVVAVTLLVVGLFGGVLAGSSPAGPGATRASAAISESALSGVGAGDSAATVQTLEAAVTASPRDLESLTSLGLAYQLRWRETGDAGYLPRSAAALQKALDAHPKDPTATLGLGNLALIQHDFRTALSLGRTAVRLAPSSARPYGVVGDAEIELGRYSEAFRTFERMVSLKPNLASYARISYARELAGNPAGAISAMALALDAAGGQPEPTAWTHVELGKLEFGLGRVDRAARHYRAALAISPGYVYAFEQLARVEAARGNLARAVTYARGASQAIPLPQFVALLASLLDRQGRTALAARERSTVGAIDSLLAANGIRVDLESAVFRADHRIRPVETAVLARKARADRPSIYGDDALGWALARSGRCDEAVRWSTRALRLGTKDALLYFHRGYAAGCAGDRADMRAWYRKALALNPHFSIQWAPVAASVVT